MNKEQPIKGKEEIYKEAWAKWANETFITDPPLKPEDCDNEHSWIYGAMDEYAKQFQTPIQSGEERLFTLRTVLEIFDDARLCDEHGMWEHGRDQYFLTRFNIDLK